MVSNSTFRRLAFLAMAAACITVTAVAKDPHPGDVNAALQARDQWRATHSQTGAVAGGYRPLSAYSYSQAASVHAQALDSYSGVNQVPAETAQEHLTEISRNLDASTKETKKLTTGTTKPTADVQKLGEVIQTHNDAAQQAVKAAQAEAAKGGNVTITGNPNYTTINHHINASAAAHRQVLKSLGIEAH